jgi:hypothetical protein
MKDLLPKIQERAERAVDAVRPLIHFIFETIPEEARYYLSRIEETKYWFLHRFHPDHRYHIVRTGLQPGFHEVDVRMLHAVMQLVTEYVEGQGGVKALAEWLKEAEELEEQGLATILTEILAIHRWWTEDFPARTNPRLVAPSKKEFEAIVELHELYKEEEQRYLLKTIELRHYLW